MDMKQSTLNSPMLPAERRAVFSLAGIFSLRMFGLFMLLPVLAIHADELPDSTPLLLGLALGIYGLTQALFQIPLGLLSDRIDRKRVIAGGLVVFALGSVIAALSDSIHGLIIGRAVQGVGAVSAAALALNADLTRNEQRTKAMAIIGISIGFTFLMSLILAPVLQSHIRVSGLFWVVAVLALVAIVVLYTVVPDARPGMDDDESAIRQRLTTAVTTPQLMQLNLGIMVLHLVLTAFFLVLPTVLVTKSGLALPQHWKLYTPILLLSVVGMAPFVMAGAKQQSITGAYRTAIFLLFISFAALVIRPWGRWIGIDSDWPGMMLSLVLFFSAFNALESILPSLVSQIAPAACKGTAMGVYNTFQFSGIFFGGLLGGFIAGGYGSAGVFVFCGAAALAWLIMSCIADKFKLPDSRVIEQGCSPD